MNRPIRPIKNKRLPSSTKNKLYIVIREENGDISLLSPDTTPEYFDNEVEDIFGFNNDLVSFQCLPKKISYTDVVKIHNIIKQDFVIRMSYNEDGYFEFCYIEVNIPNENYDVELKQYENRDVIYAKKMEEYKKDTEKYKLYKKSMKIQQLKQQINHLNSI